MGGETAWPGEIAADISNTGSVTSGLRIDRGKIAVKEKIGLESRIAMAGAKEEGIVRIDDAIIGAIGVFGGGRLGADFERIDFFCLRCLASGRVLRTLGAAKISPEISISNVDAMASTPMAEEAGLNMLRCKRRIQQEIVLQKKLSSGKIVASSNPATDTL